MGFFFFNHSNLGQELSALANQKALEMNGWVCDFLDDEDTIFLTVRCSAEPPSYLPVQLCFGDQILSSFIEGRMTARNGAARQAAICHKGPKLLSTTTHFKTKARGFLQLLVSQSRKPILFCFLLFSFLVKEDSKERTMYHSLSSQNAVL